MDVPRLTGRRPGKPDTRAQVLAAARTVFVEEGFDGATIRGIASHSCCAVWPVCAPSASMRARRWESEVASMIMLEVVAMRVSF